MSAMVVVDVMTTSSANANICKNTKGLRQRYSLPILFNLMVAWVVRKLLIHKSGTILNSTCADFGFCWCKFFVLLNLFNKASKERHIACVALLDIAKAVIWVSQDSLVYKLIRIVIVFDSDYQKLSVSVGTFFVNVNDTFCSPANRSRRSSISYPIQKY